jgi:hypothetical protein
MSSTLTTKYSWVFDTTKVESLLQELQLRNEVIDYILEASRQIAQSDNSLEFLEFCDSWQEWISQQSAVNYPASWQALAVISSFPEAIEKHRARGIPWEITKATLADFQRDARGEYADGGSWEFTRPGWMRNHVSGKFFEIGRLQYVIGTVCDRHLRLFLSDLSRSGNGRSYSFCFVWAALHCRGLDGGQCYRF